MVFSAEWLKLSMAGRGRDTDLWNGREYHIFLPFLFNNIMGHIFAPEKGSDFLRLVGGYFVSVTLNSLAG